MKMFVVYFKYQKPTDKKPGPVTHYKIHAATREEAEQIVTRQARYPGLQIVRIDEVRTH